MKTMKSNENEKLENGTVCKFKGYEYFIKYKEFLVMYSNNVLNSVTFTVGNICCFFF